MSKTANIDANLGNSNDYPTFPEAQQLLILEYGIHRSFDLGYIPPPLTPSGLKFQLVQLEQETISFSNPSSSKTKLQTGHRFGSNFATWVASNLINNAQFASTEEKENTVKALAEAIRFIREESDWHILRSSEGMIETFIARTNDNSPHGQSKQRRRRGFVVSDSTAEGVAIIPSWSDRRIKYPLKNWVDALIEEVEGVMDAININEARLDLISSGLEETGGEGQTGIDPALGQRKWSEDTDSHLKSRATIGLLQRSILNTFQRSLFHLGFSILKTYGKIYRQQSRIQFHHPKSQLTPPDLDRFREQCEEVHWGLIGAESNLRSRNSQSLLKLERCLRNLIDPSACDLEFGHEGRSVMDEFDLRGNQVFGRGVELETDEKGVTSDGKQQSEMRQKSKSKRNERGKSGNRTVELKNQSRSQGDSDTQGLDQGKREKRDIKTSWTNSLNRSYFTREAEREYLSTLDRLYQFAYSEKTSAQQDTRKAYDNLMKLFDGKQEKFEWMLHCDWDSIIRESLMEVRKRELREMKLGVDEMMAGRSGGGRSSGMRGGESKGDESVGGGSSRDLARTEGGTTKQGEKAIVNRSQSGGDSMDWTPTVGSGNTNDKARTQGGMAGSSSVTAGSYTSQVAGHSGAVRVGAEESRRESVVSTDTSVSTVVGSVGSSHSGGGGGGGPASGKGKGTLRRKAPVDDLQLQSRGG